MHIPRGLRYSVVVLLCVSIFMMGCSANNTDLASNADEFEGSARARVIGRLEQLGYDRHQAVARTEEMGPDEINYFAQHPEAIKRTGAIIALGVLLSSTFFAAQSGAKEGAEQAETKKETTTIIIKDKD